MEQLLKTPELPEVIVLHSDLMLGGVLKIARQHSIRIPEDIAVTSYDNLRKVPSFILKSPPLIRKYRFRQRYF